MVEALIQDRALLIERTAQVTVECHMSVETEKAALSSTQSYNALLEAKLSEARKNLAELARRADEDQQRAEALDAER